MHHLFVLYLTYALLLKHVFNAALYFSLKHQVYAKRNAEKLTDCCNKNAFR